MVTIDWKCLFQFANSVRLSSIKYKSDSLDLHCVDRDDSEPLFRPLRQHYNVKEFKMIFRATFRYFSTYGIWKNLSR